ncbi:hypothetical protein DD237_008395 [Peronospora effusa]|uniref:Uncharacterized protein n=1 Tax=Peronospora effusa TaxID=542832 RepID=A0A425CNH4_9STRA|nr:hypothetical protein DD237_008395 [Peronospora effusa]
MEHHGQRSPEDTIEGLGKVQENGACRVPSKALREGMEVLESNEGVADGATTDKPSLVRMKKRRKNSAKTPRQNLRTEFRIMVKKRDRSIVTREAAITTLEQQRNVGLALRFSHEATFQVIGINHLKHLSPALRVKLVILRR